MVCEVSVNAKGGWTVDGWFVWILTGGGTVALLFQLLPNWFPNCVKSGILKILAKFANLLMHSMQILVGFIFCCPYSVYLGTGGYTERKVGC